MTGKIGQLNLGKSGNLLRCDACGGMLASYDVLLASQDKVNHANQIGFEFCLAGFAAPGSVTAGAFDFSEIAEFPRGGNQNVVHENGGIALDAKPVSKFGSAKVLGDEGNLTRIFGRYVLDQQTCRVGYISSVRPAD